MPISFATAPPAPFDDAHAVAALFVATRAWMIPACSGARLATLPTSAMPGDGAGDGRNEVIVHATDWPAPLGAGAVAHTVIYVVGDRIVEADVHLNAKDYAFADGDVAGTSDLRAVLTHELGHLLGIGHSEVPRATMAAGLPAGIAARSLEDDDVAAVCALYPGTGSGACDLGEACPAGYSCVGRACERAGETATLGAPCAAATIPHRCEGAGDRARCIATTLGERCTLPCPEGAASSCGAAMRCVALRDGTRVCMESDALEAAGDAGAGDGASDAAIHEASTDADAPSSATGGGCTTSRSRRASPLLFALSLALAIAARRR